MRREKVWERRLVTDALDKLGLPSIKLLHMGGETGWPDRQFFVMGGKPALIEAKEVGYKPEPRQTYIHSLLSLLGYEVRWFDNYEDAYAYLEALVAEAGKVGSTSSPEAGHEVPRRTRSRRPVVRPRPRKN